MLPPGRHFLLPQDTLCSQSQTVTFSPHPEKQHSIAVHRQQLPRPTQRWLQSSCSVAASQRCTESRDGHLAIKVLLMHKCTGVCSMTTGTSWRRWQGGSLTQQEEQDPALLMPAKLQREPPWSCISLHSSGALAIPQSHLY